MESLKAELGRKAKAGAQADDWRLTRVTLSLAVELRGADRGTPTWEVTESQPGEAAGVGAPHRITVEFELGEAGMRVGEPAQASSAKSPLVTGRTGATASKVDGGAGVSGAEREEQWVASLEELLGPPGFDSSARARVLVEALESLAPGQQRELLAGLDAPEPLGDEAVERVRHQVLRVLERGPSGGRRGARLLAEATGHRGLETVLRRIAERWHTREWWDAEGAGRSG